MDGNQMNEEMALLAALQREIAGRLRPVCADLTDDAFEELVREIAAVKIKYSVESEDSTSLRAELTTILHEESSGVIESAKGSPPSGF